MEVINPKFVGIFALNLLLGLCLILNQHSSGPLLGLSHKQNLIAGFSSNDDYESPYKFDDPIAAFQILEQLDIFQEINEGELSAANYTDFAGGFTYNDNYCKEHREYFVDAPEIVFKEVNFVSNYWADHKLRTDIIDEVGYDLHPEVTAGNRELRTKFEYDLDPTANLFFTFNFFFLKRQVGKQFSCLSQESNHIPGHDYMVKKDKLQQSLANYAETYKSKPACFSFNQYFRENLDTEGVDQLLFNNEKFRIRNYLLIASTNPVIAFYHHGYYTVLSDPETYGSSKDLQEYLEESGRVNDPKFLQNYLVPEYKRAMIHLVRMTQNDFFKISSVFELLAVDFVLDNNHVLWFVEANPTPLLTGFTGKTAKVINKMLIDTFEIVMGLLRSRMKRVVLFVNEISKEMSPGSADIPNLGQKRHEFIGLTMNNIEPEYVPSKGNSFRLIIDENKEGTSRYSDLISEDCL